ncbi:MAG: winged helix-turn-helix transcriptional regulator [Candidatus Latescibacteria bacterium]|jgi:DNA-binding transcriptional ArsR family regulator|nr:winged helix-turn-helix transcriptional regulator [Candidatus Latescibacterota bacterium]
MRQFMDVVRAMADENRVKALLALRQNELCVCQIIEFLGLAPSTVSKHMSILKQARLVDSRKDGRWIYYRLAGDSGLCEVNGALDWLGKCFDSNSLSGDDEKKLKMVLCCGPPSCDHDCKN